MRSDSNGSEILEHKRVRQRHAGAGGPGRSRIGLNITAMIDVVFLLLIYFMAATNFKLGEEIFRMDLPERGRAVEADPFRLDVEPVRIVVRSAAGGSYQIQVEGPLAHQPSSFDELYRFLRERRIGPSQPSGLFDENHPMIVEPVDQARWEHAIGAFNAAVRAQYTNVSFRSAG